MEKGSVDHIDKEVPFGPSEEAQAPPLSIEENKRILRKIDCYMMPVFCAIVALQFLDKTALTYTSVMGLGYDTKMVGNQYAWLGSMFSIGFLVGQYPMCYLQQRLPLAKFTAFNIIVWGLCVACMSACNNFEQLLATRFFLGFFESSISPALMLFTAQWYRKKEQGTRTGVWMSFTTWGGILGAGIAYGLFRGDLARTLPIRGWRILFIIFGCLTIFIGFIFALVVPDQPEKAWFLSLEDKSKAKRRTAENLVAINERTWRWYQVKEALLDPQVIMMTLIALFNSIPNGGITNFYALMVVGMGIEIGTGILLSMINCWVSIVMIVTMFLGDKLRCRTLIGAAPHIVSMVGGILVWKLPVEMKKARLAGFYLTLVYSIALVACMSLISSNVAGRTKKTVAAALFFVISCVGNLIGPQTFRAKDAPRYIPALIAIVICNVLTIATMGCLFAYYRYENRRRDRIAGMGQSSDVCEPVALDGQLGGEQDLTDRENLRFRYCL